MNGGGRRARDGRDLGADPVVDGLRVGVVDYVGTLDLRHRPVISDGSTAAGDWQDQ